MCSVVSQYRCSVKKRYKKTQSSSDYANSTSVAFSKLHSAMTSVTLIAYIQVLIQWIGTQPKSDPFVFFLSIRANQENLEPKEAEVFQVSVAWKDRKEHQVIKVRNNSLIIKSSLRVVKPGSSENMKAVIFCPCRWEGSQGFHWRSRSRPSRSWRPSRPQRYFISCLVSCTGLCRQLYGVYWPVTE